MASAGVHEWEGGRLKRDFLDDLARLDVLAAAARVRSATLVTHGRDDKVVPVSDASLLYEALAGPKELAITDRCDHRYADPAHFHALVDRAVRWIAMHLPAPAADDASEGAP